MSHGIRHRLDGLEHLAQCADAKAAALRPMTAEELEADPIGRRIPGKDLAERTRRLRVFRTYRAAMPRGAGLELWLCL